MLNSYIRLAVCHHLMPLSRPTRLRGFMKELEERIAQQGTVKPGNVLKVDAFLNHQCDVELFDHMGAAWAEHFKGKTIDKILTIEASGIGIACVVGYVVAIFMGKVDFSGFANLQVVSVPHFMPFKLEFDPGAIISFALLYVVSSVEVLGDTAALTKVGLDRQPTDKETAGAIAGDGLISSVSGLFGCLPLTSFAQNIGLVAMTKVVNRKVILSGGLILVLASFVPAVAEVFNSLPQAVLGGCTIMMFGNIILSGFQMISEAGYTQRNITIAALSLTIGIGFTQVGDMFANFPALFQSIFASNCIAVSFVVAVILNAVLPSEEHFLSAPQHQEA